MERFSVREVLEQAIRTERLGHDFYKSMAEKFKESNDFQHLFDTLAKKELVHEKRFKELLEILGNDEPEGWGDVSEYIRAMVESEFFLGSDKALTRMKGAKDIKEAVEFAMAFEKETLLYFVGLRDAVKEKDIVDEIISEERSHIKWLNSFKSKFIKQG
jgi:rubrerythrin